jgi:hypothetical protein
MPTLTLVCNLYTKIHQKWGLYEIDFFISHFSFCIGQ